MEQIRSTTARRSAALTLVVVLATAVPLAAQQPWTCATPPVEPCAKRHGRLSSQNGIPLRLWLIGTTRVVALENNVDALPSEINRYLDMTSDDHSYIFGDFVVCPLAPYTPGQMGRACVTDAERLVVQPLRRPRPPFRILSTWPVPEQEPPASR